MSRSQYEAHGQPIPPTIFEPDCHPLVETVSRQTNGYFLEKWPFPDEKSRIKFVKAGFSRVTCQYFPHALDDRIHFAARLLTILFLVDDLLESMSLEEGRDYNDQLKPFIKGIAQPDENSAAQTIMANLWAEMRSCDAELAEAIVEPLFVFMDAQTDRRRLTMKGIGNYLIYREKDVGKGLLSTLMCFAMDLHLPAAVRPMLARVESNCSNHISVVNDIYSFPKELAAAREGRTEGTALCSAVSVLADELNFSYDAAIRVLWAMCREWELCHLDLCDQALTQVEGSAAVGLSSRESHSKGIDPVRVVRDLKAYLKGVELQMGGNEAWSNSSQRYHTTFSTPGTAAKVVENGLNGGGKNGSVERGGEPGNHLK